MAFVAVVCLSLLAIDFWNSWEARTDQLQQMNVATSNLSRAMAQQADDTIKKADTVLVGMVERVEHDGIDPSDVARLRQLLALRVAELPSSTACTSTTRTATGLRTPAPRGRRT